MVAAWVGIAATFAGALALYVAAPHQALVRGVVARGAWKWAGMLMSVAALALLLTAQGPATAVFTWVTTAMAAWSIVPVAARWHRFRREAAR